MTSSIRTLTCEQARVLDRQAVERYAMPSLLLMENAGRGVVDVIEAYRAKRSPELSPLAGTFDGRLEGPAVICCGRGNNAGDGLVIARHLELRGYGVQVLLFAEPNAVQGDAGVNLRIVERSGVPLILAAGAGAVPASDWKAALGGAGFLVDALLGTGARGAPRAPFDEAIVAINAAQKPIVAVDLPSGLNADSGEAPGAVIQASVTCTFVAAKPGLLQPAARQAVGALHVVDIGAPAALLRETFGGAAKEQE